MYWQVIEITSLAAIQTVIVNVLLLNQFPLRPTLHWFWLGITFAFTFVLLKRSKGARCVSMLLVPQFISKRGRAALIGYIFLLTVTGPTANTMHNVEVLGETLSCTQEQLKVAILDTISALKVPFLAMKKIIDELLKTVERSFMKVQGTLMEMLKLVKRILHSMKKAYNWLGDVVSVCNDKLGTPSERCLQALDQTIDGCKEEMGAMDFLCEVTQVGKTVCYGAKMVDYFCELIDFISDAVIEEIEQGIQNLMHNLEELFRVKVEYDHTFDFASNASKTLAEVGAEIRQEIADRTVPLRRTFNIMGLITSGFFICIVLRAVRYWKRYLKKDDFDNNFLTEDFYAIECRRLKLSMETIFPLTRKESRRYVPLTSLRLTWKEWFRIAKSITFLAISTVQICGQLAADYALYWLLTLIKHFMHEGSSNNAAAGNSSNVITPLAVGVSGEGILADTLRDIVRSFDPIVNGTAIDPSQCIPDASPPRFGQYGEIGVLLVLCWCFAFVEPYGLRVRQLVMQRYYPVRARSRALWLYNDILLKRESLLKILRNHIVGAGDCEHSAEVHWLDVVRAKTNRYWICRTVLGQGGTVRCILCGDVLRERADLLVRCPGAECPGIYCQDCLMETGNNCSLCLDVLMLEARELDKIYMV
ncbi:DC-STAMP domain-containing protein 2-like [Anopheles maculipalpis]|uniref:DC-STAMP domain-containing protein 2-like n=1 Tax=Anopheles maculipalpis TaxID=1496333 RepID=UPI002158A973|nr:DC-STAMP domain-containing protein 2-like [Anopheles maculipalpis]